MTLDIRALGFLLFLIAAGVIIYAMSGPRDQSGVGIGATDPKRFPWVLEECTRPPYFGWKFVARYPSERICEKWKRKREASTGRLHRCRLDSRAEGDSCG